MLQNAYVLAKIGADTAENEQHFAENLPTIGNCPTGRIWLRVIWRSGGALDSPCGGGPLQGAGGSGLESEIPTFWQFSNSIPEHSNPKI